MRLKSWLTRRPLLYYFSLTLAISWAGIFIIFAVRGFDLSPMQPLEGVLIFLAMLSGPSLSGLLFTTFCDGYEGLRQLGARMMRWQLGVHWYAFALLTIPMILLTMLPFLSVAVDPVFAPRFNWALFAVGLLAGSVEEIGWTGFATPRLLARLGVTFSGLLLGLVWALWHLLVDFRYNAQTMGAAWPLEFAIVYLATLTPYRMLMTWVYSNTQSLLLAILMHASFTGWLLVLFPATSLTQSLYWQSAFALVLWSLAAVVLRKVKMMHIPVSFLMACIVIVVGTLLLWSPGKPTPFVGENGSPLQGSISEKIFVKINGVEQGMFIKSKDATNPVLLYLHGGLPDYFLTQKYPTGLENVFTVVWWEQRGSGLSYNADAPPDAITVEQLISDTLEMTNYLRHRFGQEKIYLMGHSGGTFIGIQAAARAPELYRAYIGVAQMSYQLKSEVLAYDYMLRQYNESGNAEMARKLWASPVTMAGGIPDSYLALRDQAMHNLGIGTTHDMKSVLTGIFLPSLTFTEYTLSDKINLWRGKSHSGVSALWDAMIATDLSKRVHELKIPVYFFGGIYDYTCSYILAKDYLLKLDAPVKGFYTFQQSAHSPMFEEPERVQRILREDILAGGSSLADKM